MRETSIHRHMLSLTFSIVQWGTSDFCCKIWLSSQTLQTESVAVLNELYNRARQIIGMALSTVQKQRVFLSVGYGDIFIEKEVNPVAYLPCL